MQALSDYFCSDIVSLIYSFDAEHRCRFWPALAELQKDVPSEDDGYDFNVCDVADNDFDDGDYFCGCEFLDVIPLGHGIEKTLWVEYYLKDEDSEEDYKETRFSAISDKYSRRKTEANFEDVLFDLKMVGYHRRQKFVDFEIK